MAAKSKLMLMSKIKAKKKPEHKAAVEGDAPRQRLDRPGRMRMRRADGGVTISEDSKKEVERLRDHGDKNAMIAAGKGATAGFLINRLGQAMGGSKPASRAVGTAAGLLGMGADERTKKAADAFRESNRIERGEAEPGKEDRAAGGRVKRADGGIVEDYIKPGLPTAVPAAIQSLARRYLPSRRDPEMEAKLKDAASNAATGAGGALMKAGLRPSGKAVDGKEDRKRGGRVCK